MTTTVTKVDKKWEVSKVQEATSKMFASLYVSAFETISKLDSKALEQFNDLCLKHKVEHYKTLGIKTPMDLAKAVAETEHNVFGSQIEILGDENKATIKYVSCGMWKATQELHKFSPEQEKLMHEQCQMTSVKFAKEFGFKFEQKMEKDSFEMTFSK